MKLEILGKVFDSDGAELTMGDMEALEAEGIDLAKMSAAGAVPISQMNKIALRCLNRVDPTVDEAFVKAIPISRLSDVAEFVNGFFSLGSAGGDGGS